MSFSVNFDSDHILKIGAAVFKVTDQLSFHYLPRSSTLILMQQYRNHLKFKKNVEQYMYVNMQIMNKENINFIYLCIK